MRFTNANKPIVNPTFSDLKENEAFHWNDGPNEPEYLNIKLASDAYLILGSNGPHVAKLDESRMNIEVIRRTIEEIVYK